MRQITKAKTKDEVNFLFEQLETINDNNIKVRILFILF